MRNRWFSLISLFFVCISFCYGQPENSIKAFEKSFGRKNSSKLTRMVTRFETLLSLKFGDSPPGSYRQYVEEASRFPDKEPLRDMKESEHLFRLMKKSRIAETLWLMPDSCWVEGKSIVCRYLSDGDTLLLKITGRIPVSPEDAMKNRKKDNLDGLFFRSLETAAAYYPLLKDYTESRQYAGDFFSPAFYEGWQDPQMDLSDYFIKRCVLLYLFFHHYTW